MSSLLIRNGTVVTLDDAFTIVEGGVLVCDGRLAAVGAEADRHPDAAGARVLDAAGGLILPGFVQTHVHLCQTLFRGMADDLPLLRWLAERVWPLEAAHSPATLAASARLACAELLLGGTTTVLTMETVHDTDAVADAVAATGLRAVLGPCLMDRREPHIPPRLWKDGPDAIGEALALHRAWRDHADGRIRVALAPRFALSCSRGLLEAVAATADDEGLLVHTHSSEQRDEVAAVVAETGLRNMAYLAATGLASPRLCTAHAIWLDEHEMDLVAGHDVKVLHCPTSNFKLGSGMAHVPEMRARGITVSLGADGAACSNRLDMFDEMRLAATMQAVRLAPGALPAREVVWMATRGGSRTLGLGAEIGSLEAGKRADVIVVDRGGPHATPAGDPYSTLVYSARATDVRHVVVDGTPLVEDFALTTLDVDEVTASAREAARTLVARAGL